MAVEMKGLTRKQKLIAKKLGSVNYGCLFLILSFVAILHFIV